MKIFGIDPGTDKSGFVLYDSESHSIIESGIENNNKLLHRSTWADCDIVVIEMVASYGQAVGQTTFDTVVWVGRFVQYAYSINLPYHLYYKKRDINPTLCFSSKVKDSNIRQAILDMFPPIGGGSVPQKGTKSQPGPLYNVSSHSFSALAVALTHAIKHSLIQR